MKFSRSELRYIRPSEKIQSVDLYGHRYLASGFAVELLVPALVWRIATAIQSRKCEWPLERENQDILGVNDRW